MRETNSTARATRRHRESPVFSRRADENRDRPSSDLVSPQGDDQNEQMPALMPRRFPSQSFIPNVHVLPAGHS